MSAVHAWPDAPLDGPLPDLGRSHDFAQPTERYRGDALGITLADLAPEDRPAARALYNYLVELKALLDEDHGRGALPDLEAWIDDDALERTMRVAARLGSTLDAGGTTDTVRQAYHDLRGGSLQALLMHLDLAAEGEAEPGDDERVFILVRDQLKMMRNAVTDLDPDVYASDLEPRGHAMSLLHDKWSDVVYPTNRGPVRVRFDAPTDGDVAERCMEFSALDRVLYNLVNNAAQHGLGDEVHVSIVPVDGGDQLQFRVVNGIAAEQAARLAERFGGDDVSALLKGGFTTGGHGVGTRICAEMVRHGYGLESVEQVIQGGYAGARLVDGRFVAFFHWPALAAP